MTSLQPYDFNFCFTVPDVLENDRVKLVPFIPSIHARPFFAATENHPELYKNVTWGPFPDVKTYEYVLENYFRKEAGSVLFAILDKTQSPVGESGGEDVSGTLAGALGYINSSPANLCTEIGAVVVLPPFQRTHVASNAVGLLLQYALNLPSRPTLPGLGLRRVAWLTNCVNTPSIRLAERLGFQKEGVVRWEKVLPEGKGAEVANGKGVRDGDPRAQCLGRDSVMLSLCWDDWEGGGRERVEAVMARRV